VPFDAKAGESVSEGAVNIRAHLVAFSQVNVVVSVVEIRFRAGECFLKFDGGG
jgi:hypothetical protein